MSAKRVRLPAGRESIAATCILLGFTCLAAVYSLVTPLFEGYDEHWHYAYVQHIASGRGLPRQPAADYPHLARQEASQPPLYYALGAALTWWIAADDLPAYLRENPQFAAVPWGYRDNQNVIVHTPAEHFPYSGTPLAVHLNRLLSVLMGAGAVYCTYALSRLLFPGRAALALGTMALTAFTPGFLFASSLVNNDILVILLASVTLVLLARIWARERHSRVTVVLLGVVLGCAALTKLTGLLLWLFSALTLAIVAWRRREPGIVLRVLIPAFVLAGLIAGWWYIRNLSLYGDVTGLNMMLDVVGRRDAGFGLGDVLAEFEGIRRSYWALFGWFNVTVPVWLYTLFDLASVLALAGLALRLFRLARQCLWAELWALVFLLAWLAFSLVGLVRWTLTTPGSQGRLVYPAISAISILMVVGWLALLPQRQRIHRGFVTGLAIALAAISLYVPFFAISPAYATPELQTPAAASATVSQELDHRFADNIRLLGYDIDSQEVAPGDLLWVTACWQGLGKIDQDLLVFVQLLVENDLIAAQKDTFHGLGSFPTSQWPEGASFCDRYPLRVAGTVPASSQASILIGLYRRDGERLQVSDPSGQPLGDSVRLDGPRVALPASGHVLDYSWGNQVALVDYQLDRTAVTPGESINLALSWRAVRPISANYVATVQILGEGNAKIGQTDIALPTSTWQPGEVVEDLRSIEIWPDAAPGVYAIKVGVYDPETIENLTLRGDDQVVPGGGLLRLWTLRVP